MGNEKAFPQSQFRGDEPVDTAEHGGMQLRDYFAAKAMQGIMSKQAACGDQLGDLSVQSYIDVSIQAYLVADAMMEARNK